MKMSHLQRRAYNLATAHIGVKEIKGAEDNPEIVNWFKRVGHSWVDNDETAWCAAFMGACLLDAGLPSTGALNARSYLDWGVPVMQKEMQQGDVLIYWRGSKAGWQGHVGFYAGQQSATSFLTLGGNQSDMVKRSWYSKSQLLGIRRYPATTTGPDPDDSCWTRFLRGFMKGGDTKLRNQR